jgi:hypothetical protein
MYEEVIFAAFFTFTRHSPTKKDFTDTTFTCDSNSLQDVQDTNP